MHAGTFVPFRHIGKTVGSFYLKHAKNIHGRIVPSMDTLRNQFNPLSSHPHPGYGCNIRLNPF
jgi:hypothetical protein